MDVAALNALKNDSWLYISIVHFFLNGGPSNHEAMALFTSHGCLHMAGGMGVRDPQQRLGKQLKHFPKTLNPEEEEVALTNRGDDLNRWMSGLNCRVEVFQRHRF